MCDRHRPKEVALFLSNIVSYIKVVKSLCFKEKEPKEGKEKGRMDGRARKRLWSGRDKGRKWEIGVEGQGNEKNLNRQNL